MRNLIIVRRKTLVASTSKLRVYIEDAQGDLAFDGRQYRKLGELKNGETGVYTIDDNACRVLVSYGAASRKYCHDSCAVPEGSEDITLSGQAQYNPVSGNAFRFDSAPDGEALRSRKKGGRRGVIVLIAALVLGFAIGVVCSLWEAGFFDGEPAMKTFTTDNLSITLTEDFIEDHEVGVYNSGYTDGPVIVITKREMFYVFEAYDYTDLPLVEYAEILLELYQDTVTDCSSIHSEDGFVWIEYNGYGANGQEYHYIDCMYKSSDSFWIVEFATKANQADKHREDIMKYARSVKVD